MHTIIYLLLGLLDVYALFAIMFRSFRLPYFEYKFEISIIACLTSIVSYLVRVYFNAPPMLDIVLHFMMYIIFFRYLIKVRVWRALIISLMYFGYGVISALWYFIYAKSGLLAMEALNNPNSYAPFLIQISQILSAFLITYILYKFNLGFSFIVRPPHDFFVRKRLSKNDTLMISGIMLVAAITFCTIIFVVYYEIAAVIPLNVLIFCLVIYLAYRRDRKRD